MASEPDQTASSEQAWVVIASFPNRHAAERMLASLGPGFRRNANKGHAEAFVITGNADGSLKLTNPECWKPAVLLPPSPASPSLSWSG